VTHCTKQEGDSLNNQQVANAVFDYAVNAGIKTSAILAQSIVGATADGVIGPNSINAINSFNADHFIASFKVGRITPVLCAM
jgi:lysozyme family protein